MARTGITLSRGATWIRDSITGLLYPKNVGDKIATETLESVHQYSGTTTNATQTELYIGGVSGEQFSIPANTAFGFFIRVVGMKVGGGDIYHAIIEGTIKRVVAASTTAFVASASDIAITAIKITDATWGGATVEADTTNGALALKVTGKATTTIHWVADLDYVKAS